ncbi:hypothetical protein J6590_071840 [Homalodisca vitripennis]|nr:hypothetical protein J6590_071840 [Homalodisca vitripennis]
METCNEARFLRRLLKESNAVQLINEPTRVTATSATLLDHIIVDRSAEVERTGVIDATKRAVVDIAGIDWDSAMNIVGVDNIEQFITINIRKVFDEQARECRSLQESDKGKGTLEK